MYHSVIGKKLVACLNRRDGKNYTVREFFDSVYVPLFFGSERLLQYVNNSPFDQTFSKQKKQYSPELLHQCLTAVHGKVVAAEPDASFYLGGPAAGVAETTSGQVTALKVPIPHEDVYASWIGAALGLTVQGGMTLLIDAEDVLLATYDGWSEYRRFLDQTPSLKGLQINAWNGQWIAYGFGENPFIDPDTNKDKTALETASWVRLLFMLSAHYHAGPIEQPIAYVYSLGQSNKTLGFVRLNLQAVEGLYDIYRRLFSAPEGMPHARFAALYETERGFHAACAQTEIGLKALKPKDVYQAQSQIPKPPQATDQKHFSFDIYQTWIIAMLKNEELNSKAKQIADALAGMQEQGKRAKSDHSQKIKSVLEKRNRREFIEALTDLVGDDAATNNLFDTLVDDIIALPTDHVPLFLTLLRFKYAIASKR